MTPMATAAQEYRRQARECMRAAKLATGQDAKASLLAMADRWLEFAEAMERFAMAQTAISPPRHLHVSPNRAPRAASPRGRVRRATA